MTGVGDAFSPADDLSDDLPRESDARGSLADAQTTIG
jgi:hypothetical protein